MWPIWSEKHCEAISLIKNCCILGFSRFAGHMTCTYELWDRKAVITMLIATDIKVQPKIEQFTSEKRGLDERRMDLKLPTLSRNVYPVRSFTF